MARSKEEEATLARQQKQLEALTEALQKVSAQVVGNKATLCRGPLRELCQPPPDVRCGHKKPATDCFPEKRRPTREFRPSRRVRFGRDRMQRNTVPTD
jgi:hypothetical protein